MSHSAEQSKELSTIRLSGPLEATKPTTKTKFGVAQHGDEGGYLDVVGASKTGQSLRFRNVGLSVALKKGSKTILDGCTGSVDSGQLCAIVGPSGAGKTSLMDVLSGRIGSGISDKSEIELNGARLTRSIARKKIAFVAQDDALFATSTPREALYFSARLRLPRSATEADVHKVVEDVIVKLGLTGCADSTIGDVRMRGLSGGERKRTSIAVELVTNPSVLFLDEPTSGLDSYAALETIKLLKSLSDQGCVVLCSIHQPSSEIFSAFDKVILLAQGHLIYGGERKQLLPHFKGLGHVCPEQYNPADFVLFMAQTSSAEAIATFKEEWKSKDANSGWDASKVASTEDLNAGAEKAGFGTQIMLIASRDWKAVVRNKPALIARFGMTAFLNLLFGCIFYNSGRLGDTPDEARTHFGALAQIFIGAMFGSANPVLLAFPLERPVFLREYSTATYGLWPYFLSKTVVELVLGFLTMAVAILVPYWIMDLQGSVFLLICAAFALSSVSASVALVMGCATKDVKVALELSPLIFVPQILFAGFFIKMEQIPDMLRWAQYLCSLKFAMNLALIAEFGGDAGCPANNTLRCETSADLLAENDVNEDDWWVYVLVLALLFIVFRITAATCLAAKAHG